MSTISVSDLKKKSAKQWQSAAKKSEVVVVSDGKPVAVLLSVDAESLQPTLSALRSVRALQAQTALQEGAGTNGTATLGLADINSEITATRRTRRRK
ncbi:MAG TPA: type II toxin-antitoxin system prevent-host-death family antitoxin [Candidatus Binatia bacterium]|nr:type II toxin-antitoxin system prevent-host-death family antitoxin [Candidatus Binatia bacterium]